MKRFATLLAVSGLALGAAPGAAWGPTGHRIVAQIAQDNVSGQTRARIEQILGHEQLPEGATWPDEQRSSPDVFLNKTTYPWHFVTLAQPNEAAEDLVHPPEGDAVTAIERFTRTLRDPAASQGDKAVALRFLVHIIGDLHQPLHVGKDGDRGGNDVKVLWLDFPVQKNLHWVWDEGMIEKQGLSFTEYADRLEARMTPQQAIDWWTIDPNAWMDESISIRNRLYPEPSDKYGDGTVENPFKLEYHYIYDWNPTMEQRLQQAGIRTAAYLDWVFAGPSTN
ncbi:S1/P1 Nuclease [Altererythrobacter salegens]|uniref:S1/P1 Nuclease n=1 Tax=Croceibacterium salegens TaxID=1737568 RepID=A0A6I4SXQ3_9SPHN|nr:S1/P1 nuclease [Croceibacterium salegens]MXO60218.1 S1/P1 Nuclease [Croceibacterium salegens]